MNARPILTGTLTALGLVALTGPAFALDAYRDRTGIYYGAGLGFGAGKADTDGAETEAGLSFHGRVGGGVNQTLTLDFDLGYLTLIDADTGLLTGFVGVNFFPAGDLYLRLMGGIAHASFDEEGTTGFGAGAGLGYEFWANADMAIGVGVDFQHHFYDEGAFDALTLGVTFSRY